MSIKIAIAPLEVYLLEQIAAEVFELRKLHECIVKKVGLSEDMVSVSCLLELLWVQATRPLIVEA